MSDTYEINQFDKVVPYTSGRKSLDTRSYRDATDLELSQKERIEELESLVEELEEKIDNLECIILEQGEY